MWVDVGSRHLMICLQPFSFLLRVLVLELPLLGANMCHRKGWGQIPRDDSLTLRLLVPGLCVIWIYPPTEVTVEMRSIPCCNYHTHCRCIQCASGRLSTGEQIVTQIGRKALRCIRLAMASAPRTDPPPRYPYAESEQFSIR